MSPQTTNEAYAAMYNPGNVAREGPGASEGRQASHNEGPKEGFPAATSVSCDSCRPSTGALVIA